MGMNLLIVDEKNQGYKKEYSDVKELKSAIEELIDEGVTEILIKRETQVSAPQANCSTDVP